MAYKGKTVEVSCALCGKLFQKSKKEYVRSIKVGRRHFCGLSCSGKTKNAEFERSPLFTTKGLHGNHRKPDALTPFRWFMARFRGTQNQKRMRCAKREKSDQTAATLKVLWDKQGGWCPLTGWKMILPRGTVGKWPAGNRLKRASIDRIDNDKGYVTGNIRLVCVIANYARNRFSDYELLSFCQAVADHNTIV